MPKEKRFNCRISAEDHEKISSKAAEAGMTMMDFVITVKRKNYKYLVLLYLYTDSDSC